MIEACREILEYIQESYGSNLYLWIYLVCLVYLFFSNKKWRWILVYPGILLFLFIINPIGYTFIWRALEGDTYWRLFWMIPVLPTIACAMVDLLGRLKRPVLKLPVLVLLLFMMYLGGDFLYTTDAGQFTEAENPEKLSSTAIEVADVLLREQDEVYAIIDYPLSNEIRQYTTGIHQMYGRNIEGLFMDAVYENDLQVHGLLSQEQVDYDRVCRYMRNLGYEYLVFQQSSNEVELQRSEEAGLRLIGTAGSYRIFQLS